MRTLTCLFAALSVMASAAAADNYNLPSIGQPADTVLSPAEEARIGERIVAQLHANGAILEDPELSDYINRVGRRLARHTDRPLSDFTFYVIDDPRVNAFALPGGYIGVNAGLFVASDTESELAGVLAHEIAHVTQRHIARQIQASQGVSYTTAAAMLLAILASAGNPAVIQAALTLGAANLGQQQINFTRAHELEADRLGIRTLAEADFNPNGMAGFFEKLERRSRLYGNRLPEILLTHPIGATRIAEARARARGFAIGPVRENPQYAYMAARARVLSSRQPSDAVAHFDDRRSRGGDDRAADYGYALALMRVGRAQTARDIFQQLDADGVGQPYAGIALASAQLAVGDGDAALASLTALQPSFSSYRPLNLAYADALIATGQPGAAREYLLDQSGLLGRDPEIHNLLARAASDLGNLPEAYYQQARAHRLQGEYAAAIYNLKTALALPEIAPVDASRLKAALDQYVGQCRRAWSEQECRESVEGVDG